ncbi:hypothetical protein [Luteimonas granuli]|uniref:hypothetical protein n=1 Tax=Luteimonas granuli TaxID=1176533 RepID=UPI001AEFA7D6|nr:hypothetical protein [Luteimonas granuli]
MASYRAGAFRSAIVATWIAVCFDFIEKLQELALAGDKEAEGQVSELEKIRSSGDVARALRFERDLLVSARDKFELISPLEYLDLSRLQEDRNRCAHPSLVAEGEAYNPSAELARLHIRSAVVSVLQHAPAQGKYALDRLLKEVESDYFPTKFQDALDFLSTGPLRRPRESLVRNLVVVLAKTFLLVTKDFKYKRRISAALKATAHLHPSLFNATLEEKLSPLVRQVADSELYSTFSFFQQVPDVWQFLAVDVRQKLSNYVLDMPSSHFDYVDAALSFAPLREAAQRRIKRATRKELAEIIFFDLPSEVGDRFVDIYLDSQSFDQANSWAKHMITHSGDFSADHVRRILQDASANGEVLGSFELGPLISALRKRKILSTHEFETLLTNHGLEDYAEDVE